MVSLAEIISFFENLFPSVYQESWDNTGLIIGNQENSVSRILLSLDCSEKLIDEAIEKRCELIIVHHPPIFKGITKIAMRTATEKIVYKAIKNNISIIALHTNVDNNINGINKLIANKIGLQNCTILLPTEQSLRKLVTFCPIDSVEKVQMALFSAGAGHIGNYSCCSFNSKGYGTFKALKGANPYVGKINEIHHEEEIKIEIIYGKHQEKDIINALISSHPYEEVAYDIYTLNNINNNAGSGIIGVLSEIENKLNFLTRLKNTLNCNVIKYNSNNIKTIKTIAICSGSGSFLIQKALQCKADVYITADIKYHDFAEANPSMLLVDIGHFESEIIIKELFHEHLIKKFPKFAIFISETEKNPVEYL